MKRILTSIVLAALIISVTILASFELFSGFIIFISALCFWEFAGMAENKGIAVFRIQGLIAMLILELAFIVDMPLAYMVLVLTVISVFFAAIFDPEKGVLRLSFTMLGVLYIGLCFTAPLYIRLMPYGSQLILLICFAVAGSDIGAYYIGKNFGKHKLAPSISPAKTIEGAIGGIFGSIFFAYLYSIVAFHQADTALIVTAGLIGGTVGPVGDLAESALKRYFGVKDSGTMLPGHGGVLDRVDAVMFAIPAFLIVLQLRGLL